MTSKKIRSCEAANCEEKDGHLFLWPSDCNNAEKWTQFVSFKRKDFKPDKTSRLCFKHFEDSAFANLGQFKVNLSSSLRLEKKAVPTVQTVGVTHEQQRAGLSLAYQSRSPKQRDSSSTITPRNARVLLKTDPQDLLLLEKTAVPTIDMTGLSTSQEKHGMLAHCIACNLTPRHAPTWKDSVFLHYIPKKEKSLTRHKAWMDYLRSSRSDLGKIPTCRRVCSRHFTENDYVNTLEYELLFKQGMKVRISLRNEAIPSVPYSKKHDSITKSSPKKKKLQTQDFTMANSQISEPVIVNVESLATSPSPSPNTNHVSTLQRTVLSPVNSQVDVGSKIVSREVEYTAQIETQDTGLPSSSTSVVATDTQFINVKKEPRDIEVLLPPPPSSILPLSKSDDTEKSDAPSLSNGQTPRLIIFRPANIPSLDIDSTSNFTVSQPVTDERNHQKQSSVLNVCQKSILKSMTRNSVVQKLQITASQRNIKRNQSKTNSKSAKRAKRSTASKTSKLLKKEQLKINCQDQLVEICHVFGGKLKYHNGLTYVHCRTALELFPTFKWTGCYKMAFAAKELLKCYLGDEPNETKVYCFDSTVEEDVWLDVRTYLLLIIKAYDVIRNIPKKPTLKLLNYLFVHLIPDTSELLAPLHLDPPSLRTSDLILSSPDVVSQPKGSRTCSSQTDGDVQSSYLKSLPLKEQLSHPSVIKKLAWIIQHDKYLNDVFWKAYNNGSHDTINRTPNILNGDSRAVSDVYIQTDGPGVPVLRINRIQLGSEVMHSVKICDMDKDQLQEKDDIDICPDFIPNYDGAEKMDELFQNMESYRRRFLAKEYTDLVCGNNSELSYFNEPKVLSEKEHAGSSSPGAAVNKLDEVQSSPVKDFIEILDCEEDIKTHFHIRNDMTESFQEFEPGSEEEQSEEEANSNINSMDDEEYKPESELESELESETEDELVGHRLRKCEICGIKFYNSLKKQYCCNNCKIPRGKLDDRRDTLYTYLCNKCPYKNRVLASVKNHMQVVHEGQESLYKCAICGNSFMRLCKLRRHEKIHKADKRLQCEVCGKGFTQSNNLRGHMRQHTGEKPFQCEHCGQSFTHNVSLRKHFCEILKRRIEPLDQKAPNQGRPPKKRKVAANKEVTQQRPLYNTKKLDKEGSPQLDEVTSKVDEESLQNIDKEDH